jgi:hypothetical protein
MYGTRQITISHFGHPALGFLETVLAIVVIGLAAWLLFGSSPASRAPEQQERFTNRGDSPAARRQNG